YSTAGRYLQRQGAINVPLSSAELTQLLLARGVASYELQAPPDASLDDIDWERVRRYAEHLDLAPDLPLEELLRRRGGLERVTGRPTHAGLLLFGREPERFVRGSEIIAVRYPGARMGDRFVRRDVRGPLPEQIGRAEAFVLANMRRDTVLEGLERMELEEYPPAAVREAIVNAVAHRDYAIQGEGIRLLIFSDRLEVYSPGRLPGHVTLDNLLDERYSRNQIIVQVLADLGYIERLGYGIDRMVALMEAEGLPAPTFEETANGFCVTLWGHGERLARPEPGGQSARATARWQASGLNPRQVSLLEYLDTHDQITNREYQMLCPEVSQETLRRDLAQLVRRGLLLKIGQKRGTYYVLR
ncbi:MAG: DeoR family transcriptional regulator, partial [Anaerolineae bacterium]|nr:DeoR family transcriptional regulator [Anaerolineae bacterium]